MPLAPRDARATKGASNPPFTPLLGPMLLVALSTALLLAVGLPLRAGSKDPPRYILETPGESHAGCVLRSFELTGGRVLRDGMPLEVPRWMELRQEGRTLPPFLTRDFVLLTTGDRIPLDPTKAATLDENRLRVWPAAPVLRDGETPFASLYVPHVVGAFWSVPDGVDDADRFFAELQLASRKRDVVFLRNGDRIEGTLTTIDGKVGCVLTNDAKKVTTPWANLAGIAWNTERAVRPRAKKTFARAVLEGGGRMSFSELSFDEKTRHWSGKTLTGLAVNLPADAVLALDLRQEDVVDLSDLTPARYQHQPYLGVNWPLVRDAAVSGRPLRIGENTYERGLGTHAPCQVSYRLDGQFQRFDALVGIDAAARRGRARVALDLDGKRIELHPGKDLAHGDAPRVVRQDVRNVRTLTLIVELGAFGDVQAHVNWAKARLIK